MNELNAVKLGNTLTVAGQAFRSVFWNSTTNKNFMCLYVAVFYVMTPLGMLDRTKTLEEYFASICRTV